MIKRLLISLAALALAFCLPVSFILAADASPDGGYMQVKFRLIGDALHDGGEQGHESFVTWVPTTRVFVKRGDTAYDLFMSVLRSAGLEQKVDEDTYITSTLSPAVLGSFWLSDFSNGPRSGWMYLINGESPVVGSKQYVLSEWDEVIWYYCDDYMGEEAYTAVPQISAPDVDPTGFTDLSIEDENYISIMQAVAKGYMNGKSRDVFSSRTTMTRAMLIAALYRVCGSPETEGTLPFSDVYPGDWYESALLWAYQQGIILGHENGSFKPNDGATQEQEAAILFRCAEALGMDTSARADLSGFKDARYMSEEMADCVSWASAVGLIKHHSVNLIVPDGHTSRGVLASAMCRFAELLERANQA